MHKSKVFIFLFFLLSAFVLLFAALGVKCDFPLVSPTNEAKADSDKVAEPLPKETSKSVVDKQNVSDRKLQNESDALLHLFDKMPSVTVYVKDEPIIKKGKSLERAAAYTTCETSSNPIIIVKKNFYENANRQQLVNLLKHELTHAWFCRQGVKVGHDARFRRKFESIGGFGN